MNIIQIMSTIKSTLWGGMEGVALDYSKVLQKANHKVAIYTSPRRSSIIEKKIQNIPLKRLFPFPPYIINFINKPDILHWHRGPKMAEVTKWIAKFYKIPYFATLHGGADSIHPLAKHGKEEGSYIRENMREFYQSAHALLCVGKEQFDLAKEIFPNNNVIYFPNGVISESFANKDGIDFRNKHNIPQNAFLILCMARIDYVKNLALLIKAFAEIKKITVKDIYLIVAGRITHSDYFISLQKEVKALGIESIVRFVTDINPFISDHSQAYAAADLFVLPSLNESFGIVILEAWASKKAVIASSVGGIPYLIEDQKTGLLFENNNQHDLVQKILQLMNNPLLINQLAQEGYKKAQFEYDWNNIGKKLEVLYEDAINLNKKL